MELTHIVGITSRKVVIDGNDVESLAAKPVEIHGKGGDESLALAGPHLRNPTQVQRKATHELYVIVAHAERAHRCFTHRREHLYEEVVEARAVFDPGAKLPRFALQLIVGERLHLGFERIDIGNDRFEGAQLLTFAAPQHLFEHAHSLLRLPVQADRSVSRPTFSSGSHTVCRPTPRR